MADNHRIWMVRAGAGAKLIDRFIENGEVAIGWNDLGPIEPGVSRQTIAERVIEQWPNYPL